MVRLRPYEVVEDFDGWGVYDSEGHMYGVYRTKLRAEIVRAYLDRRDEECEDGSFFMESASQ